MSTAPRYGVILIDRDGNEVYDSRDESYSTLIDAQIDAAFRNNNPPLRWNPETERRVYPGEWVAYEVQPIPSIPHGWESV